MKTKDDEFADEVCKFIDGGGFDRNIEQLLTALHNRKRTLRSVPGFRSRDDRFGWDDAKKKT